MILCIAEGSSVWLTFWALDTTNRAEIDAIPAPVDSGGMHSDVSHHEHTPFELDFSELMVPGDLDFLKYFEPSLNLS